MTGDSIQVGIAGLEVAQGPASLIQSDFHAVEDHGNLETIFVDTGNEVWHSFRDGGGLKWYGAGTVV